MAEKSIYRFMLDHLEDGRLPEGFRLPGGEEGLAPGAADGIRVFHTAPQDSGRWAEPVKKAMESASKKHFDEAESRFAALCAQAGALTLNGTLDAYMERYAYRLNADAVYRFAMKLAAGSADPECVKIGLILLSYLDDEDEETAEVLRVLGLYEEFTLYVCRAVKEWECGNDLIFDLVREVRGWGRIFALEELEAADEEIREWILYNGIDNDILPAYSALTVWESCGGAIYLEKEMSEEEFDAVSALMGAMADETVLASMSALEDRVPLMRRFLEAAQGRDLTEAQKHSVEAVRERLAKED